MGCSYKTARSWLQSLLFLTIVIPTVTRAEPRPEHMVYLRTIDPTIEQDIRYAGALTSPVTHSTVTRPPSA